MQLLVDSLRPLTKLQEADINNLEQSSHEAEEALSQQMEALQQSLAETLVNGTCVPEGSSGNMENYMGRMANAMGKLVGHEGFFREVICTSSYSSDVCFELHGNRASFPVSVVKVLQHQVDSGGIQKPCFRNIPPPDVIYPECL